MGASIKGIAIRALVEDANALLASGELSDEATGRLTEEDRNMVAEPVLDSGWYDMGGYRRLTELLRDFVGKGDPDYLKKRGAAVAERLIGLGVYQQVDFVRRMGQTGDVETAVANLKLTATLWKSFYNFGSWDVFTDEDIRGSYGMVVKDSHAMPEVGWQAIHGFMERLAQEARRSEKPISVDRRQSPEGEMLFVFGVDRG